MSLLRTLITSCCLGLVLVACSPSENAHKAGANTLAASSKATGLIPYESYQLDNGLTVIFHVDKSHPVVAVSLTAHVGSARELPGRTGFAHLFEHLLFLESENLGKGGLDKLSARIGGSGANGSTSRDRTNYLQTVPNNALEKMLWAEADKLGWFINTVTEPVLAKEKQVVKNEKRQSVDNQPYGHLFSVLGSNLYPQDHPYNWEVIGSLEDLQAATLDDVKTFYRKWYTPNNVTLVVAGDFDVDQAKTWVDKYFAEIPRGPDIKPLVPRPAVLEVSKNLYHEDNFAEQPRLAKVWPAVPQYHKDSYALNVLMSYLTDGKRAPLNEVLVDEKQVTANVGAFFRENELAGEAIFIVTAFEGTDLNTVDAALAEGFARFEENGISEDALKRIKIEQELAFYNSLGSVLGKGASLAQYSIFAKDAGFVDEDLARIQAVTPEDVMRVYETYIKDKPFIAASFVPKGGVNLIVEGAVRAAVVEEDVVQGAEALFDPTIQATYERTPSEIDRSVEPPAGPTPVLATPDIWETRLDNGIELFGIQDTEVPLAEFRMVIRGGHKLDTLEKNGAANLVSELMLRGTENKTPADFQEAIADLGASLSASAGDDAIVIRGRTLARNFKPLMALLEEALLKPRWDAFEFDLAKKWALDDILSGQANPDALAIRASNYVTYGADDIRGYSALGSETSIEGLTLEDLKAWAAANFSPELTSFRIVGDVSQANVESALAGISDSWTGGAVKLPEFSAPQMKEDPQLYFYDVPGAKQSIFVFSHTGPTRLDEDYYPATVANYILGGGGFASRLTQQLRETKGYTYGIFSSFGGDADEGSFSIFTRIRSNVTLEAAELIRDILTRYGETFTDGDLATTKSFFLNSKARSFESYGAKLGLLANIDLYDLPYDYVLQENAIVEAMTVDEIKRLVDAYVQPDGLDYVIVGNAETQLSRLGALGLGGPIQINEAVDALSD